jgi:hypothetical protein
MMGGIIGGWLGFWLGTPTAIAQSPMASDPPTAEFLDIDPEILENSPVWQRWLEDVPDLEQDIRQDPSFRSRLSVGYTDFDRGGYTLGINDVFIGRSGLTLNADYAANFEGDRASYGVDLRYYTLPLGSYVNIAPVVGYRSIDEDPIDSNGLNLGVRALLSLSRTGAADIALSQTWVNLGQSNEVGITAISAGYAITSNLRLATELQNQNGRDRWGLSLEWMLD